MDDVSDDGPTTGQLKAHMDGAWARIMAHEEDLEYLKQRLRTLRAEVDALTRNQKDDGK